MYEKAFIYTWVQSYLSGETCVNKICGWFESRNAFYY